MSPALDRVLVKVSAVCPGYIKTRIFKDSKMVKLDREKVLEKLPERFGITPQECARRILKGVEKNKPLNVKETDGNLTVAL